MPNYRAPLDDLRFVINHQLNVPQYWPSFNVMDDVDEDTVNAIFNEAAKICEEIIAPLNREADEQGCTWSEGEVTTPEGFIEAYKAFNDGGWGALSGNPAFGGMGMAKSVVSGVEEMLQGACMAFGLAPMLTAGACLAIDAHADESLKQRYLPKMYSGQWSGSMCLTEPQAGTDLGLIRTKAEAQKDGSYSITGTKIFITWGEHDMAENIVHLVLAKLPDAPPGAKGISMFLVPKILVKDDESLGERNSLSCGALEKKMGIKASATCVMNFDNATGWLVGPLNKGLACMFTMMNYERVVVGIQAIGAAHYAYEIALEYARERLQSRSPNGAVYPKKPADPIIVLPDIRRMLLSAKCHIEGGRALYIYVANCLDGAKFAKDEAQRKKITERVELLTPVTKAFLTDRSFEAAVSCQQVLGGHGYIREWGVEQAVRDIRITQIYEGTNGIQALDLLGRKTIGTKGRLVEGFCEEIEMYIDEQAPQSPFKQQMLDGINILREASASLLDQAQKDGSYPEAAAVDYLNMLGYVSVAYMWLRASVVAQTLLDSDKQEVDKLQLQAKIQVASFYFERMLPLVKVNLLSVREAGVSVMEITDEMF